MCFATPRLGTPPNPNAFLPGQSSGPVISATWDPVIDHSSFLPTARLDLLSISARSLNVNGHPAGTLLCAPPLLTYFAAPGIPFEVSMPVDSAFAGAALAVGGIAVALFGA